jgi:hypothetical protein
MNLELWCRMLEEGSLSRPMDEEVEGEEAVAASGGA